MKLHTVRSLYDKWNNQYNENKKDIQTLKEKINAAHDPNHIDNYEADMQSLLEQNNVIHQMLADLGIMVYVEDHQNNITPNTPLNEHTVTYEMGVIATSGFFKSVVATRKKSHIKGLLAEQHGEEIRNLWIRESVTSTHDIEHVISTTTA